MVVPKEGMKGRRKSLFISCLCVYLHYRFASLSNGGVVVFEGVAKFGVRWASKCGIFSPPHDALLLQKGGLQCTSCRANVASLF